METFMAISGAEKLDQAISASRDLYYRLTILVGESGSGMSDILRQAAKKHGVAVTNLNLELSQALLDLTPKQRVLRLPELLDQIAEQSSEPLVLDNLELIFDHNLKQDPLKLLKNISRNRAVVASWNGVLVDGRLTYAESGHPEYRSYETNDILTVTVN